MSSYNKTKRNKVNALNHPSRPRQKYANQDHVFSNADFSGLYNNSRFIHAACSLIGCVVSVKVKKNVNYEGVLSAISPEMHIVVELGHKVDDSTKVSWLDVEEKVIFEAADIISLKARNIDLDYVKKGTDSFIDSAIAAKTNGVTKERKLEPWIGEEGEELITLECVGDGWSADEMFRKNTEDFHVKSTYDESLKQYTTPLEKLDTPEYREAEELARRLALEIESSDGFQRRVIMENGDDADEEDRFSAVLPPPSATPSTGKYIIPNMRNRDQQKPPRNTRTSPHAMGNKPHNYSNSTVKTHTDFHNNPPTSYPPSVSNQAHHHMLSTPQISGQTPGRVSPNHAPTSVSLLNQSRSSANKYVNNQSQVGHTNSPHIHHSPQGPQAPHVKTPPSQSRGSTQPPSSSQPLKSPQIPMQNPPLSNNASHTKVPAQSPHYPPPKTHHQQHSVQNRLKHPPPSIPSLQGPPNRLPPASPLPQMMSPATVHHNQSNVPPHSHPTPIPQTLNTSQPPPSVSPRDSSSLHATLHHHPPVPPSTRNSPHTPTVVSTDNKHVPAPKDKSTHDVTDIAQPLPTEAAHTDKHHAPLSPVQPKSKLERRHSYNKDNVLNELKEFSSTFKLDESKKEIKEMPLDESEPFTPQSSNISPGSHPALPDGRPSDHHDDVTDTPHTQPITDVRPEVTSPVTELCSPQSSLKSNLNPDAEVFIPKPPSKSPGMMASVPQIQTPPQSQVQSPGMPQHPQQHVNMYYIIPSTLASGIQPSPVGATPNARFQHHKKATMVPVRVPENVTGQPLFPSNMHPQPMQPYLVHQHMAANQYSQNIIMQRMMTPTATPMHQHPNNTPTEHHQFYLNTPGAGAIPAHLPTHHSHPTPAHAHVVPLTPNPAHVPPPQSSIQSLPTQPPPPSSGTPQPVSHHQYLPVSNHTPQPSPHTPTSPQALHPPGVSVMYPAGYHPSHVQHGLTPQQISVQGQQPGVLQTGQHSMVVLPQHQSHVPLSAMQAAAAVPMHSAMQGQVHHVMQQSMAAHSIHPQGGPRPTLLIPQPSMPAHHLSYPTNL